MATAADFQNPSIAEIPESELVLALMAEPHWRQRIVGIHGIPESACIYSEVGLEGLYRKGDVDLLLVDPSRPDFATAVQVKRIKVKAETFASGRPNKLDALAELERQANLLAELGFAQVYSFVLVVVDSRTQNKGEYRFDGLTPQLRDMIAGSLELNGLEKRVGIVHCEFVQPIDHPPLTSGTSSVALKRMPQVVVQPQNLTEWVIEITRNRDSEGVIHDA